MNTYPVWTGCTPPPDGTQPRHFYYDLLEAHGESEGKLNGLQWDTSGAVTCADYQRASPASMVFDEHLVAVASDLVQRYDIDGIHLDHIRYAGANASCDPVSDERFGAPCFTVDGYTDWQRQQINGTVRKLYEQVVPLKSGLWLSAAVWPVYQDKWDWRVRSGYNDYYQDSHRWLQDGIIDSISPMIYTGSPNCASDYFWTRERWQTLAIDHQAEAHGRFVVPGMGVRYCTADDFAEIAARIEIARQAGAAGHAIFSYGDLLAAGYFDDLAAGPYAQPADVPAITWHP
jgi:uncharacterized lipoprotein YddW (UPF0748 family)